MRTSTIGWLAAALVVPGLALGAVAIAQQEPEQHAEARVDPPRGAAPEVRSLPPRPREERMSGTFTLGIPQDEAEARVNHAIDRVVAQMSFFRRSFAMRRLRDRNPVRQEVRTELEPGFVTVVYGEERHRTPTGRWESVVARGERVRLRHEVRGPSAFVQTFRSDDGEKETAFVFSPDGRHLRLDVTVRSEQLPTPLRYSLPYRRTTTG